jgi:hypothetical protein
MDVFPETECGIGIEIARMIGSLPVAAQCPETGRSDKKTAPPNAVDFSTPQSSLRTEGGPLRPPSISHKTTWPTRNFDKTFFRD